MATLIAHGTTPTGFGIRQRRNGALRPVSKCCGRSMVGVKASCKGCATEYDQDAFKLHASLNNDIMLSNYTEPSLIQQWIQNVTGYEKISLEVTW